MLLLLGDLGPEPHLRHLNCETLLQVYTYNTIMILSLPASPHHLQHRLDSLPDLRPPISPRIEEIPPLSIQLLTGPGMTRALPNMGFQRPVDVFRQRLPGTLLRTVRQVAVVRGLRRWPTDRLRLLRDYRAGGGVAWEVAGWCAGAITGS
jgi:hypothetical protein